MTNSAGHASFHSDRIRAASGTVFTFSVTGITLSGYSYNPAANIETSDSITR